MDGSSLGAGVGNRLLRLPLIHRDAMPVRHQNQGSSQPPAPTVAAVPPALWVRSDMTPKRSPYHLPRVWRGSRRQSYGISFLSTLADLQLPLISWLSLLPDARCYIIRSSDAFGRTVCSVLVLDKNLLVLVICRITCMYVCMYVWRRGFKASAFCLRSSVLYFHSFLYYLFFFNIGYVLYFCHNVTFTTLRFRMYLHICTWMALCIACPSTTSYNGSRPRNCCNCATRPRTEIYRAPYPCLGLTDDYKYIIQVYSAA